MFGVFRGFLVKGHPPMEVVPPLRVEIEPKLLLQPAASTLGNQKLGKLFRNECGSCSVKMALLASLAGASVGFSVTRLGRG